MQGPRCSHSQYLPIQTPQIRFQLKNQTQARDWVKHQVLSFRPIEQSDEKWSSNHDKKKHYERYGEGICQNRCEQNGEGGKTEVVKNTSSRLLVKTGC